MSVVLSYVVFYSFVVAMGIVLYGFLYGIASMKCCKNF